MASMAFSVTVVALSLAANTYGPRLIRTFRADLRTQLVLGIFVLVIVYLLLVLRQIEGSAIAREVPQAAVALGILLALLSVLALLAFIQNVATSIVADEVVRRVRRELDDAIGKLPDLDTRAAPTGTESLGNSVDDPGQGVALPREGYVQSVQFDELIAWAAKHDAVVRLAFRPGDFVVDGDIRVFVTSAPQDPERVRRELGRCIVSGQERTPTQDIELESAFSLRSPSGRFPRV